MYSAGDARKSWTPVVGDPSLRGPGRAGIFNLALHLHGKAEIFNLSVQRLDSIHQTLVRYSVLGTALSTLADAPVNQR